MIDPLAAGPGGIVELPDVVAGVGVSCCSREEGPIGLFADQGRRAAGLAVPFVRVGMVPRAVRVIRVIFVARLKIDHGTGWLGRPRLRDMTIRGIAPLMPGIGAVKVEPALAAEKLRGSGALVVHLFRRDGRADSGAVEGPQEMALPVAFVQAG